MVDIKFRLPLLLTAAAITAICLLLLLITVDTSSQIALWGGENVIPGHNHGHEEESHDNGGGHNEHNHEESPHESHSDAPESHSEEPSAPQNAPPPIKRSFMPYVNPLIGSEGKGHVFAGSTTPFGMAKASADSIFENQAGFSYSKDHRIQGFSQMHDEGTGGAPSLGVFPIWPFVCDNTNVSECKNLLDYNPFLKKELFSVVTSEVGYFSMKLSQGITAEMTSAQRSNLYRFTFKNSSAIKTVRMDITDLQRTVSQGSVEVTNGRVHGSGTFYPSFGESTYTVYVCTDIGNGIETIDKLYDTGKILSSTKLVKGEDDFKKNLKQSFGSVSMITENTTEVLVRVGVSFISAENACANAEREIPDFNFEQTKQKAQDSFDTLLQKIDVKESELVSSHNLTLFYSSLYRTLINPQNYTNENPLWETDQPTFDSFYCIWDTFRFTNPLFNIFAPAEHAQIIKALIDIYKNDGWLPECRMGFCRGYTQGGSNADTLLTDAYLKGLDYGIDWNEAYNAIIRDAEEEPKDWFVHGRGNLDNYKNLGYVPIDDDFSAAKGMTPRTVSRTMEYAANDYSIALFAQKLGRPSSEVEKYMNRSRNWENVWKDDAVEPKTGFKGFPQPRFKNGEWAPKAEERCNKNAGLCGIGLAAGDTEFYEESAFTYSWYVPQNYSALVERVGGPDKFVERLDAFHDQGFVNYGNEPGLMTSVLYHFAGRPEKSIERTRKILCNVFEVTYSGLPGNDDSGSLGAFVVWVMMGMVPIAGSTQYLLLLPHFPEIYLHETQTRIVVNNFGVNRTHVDSIKLNGKEVIVYFLSF